MGHNSVVTMAEIQVDNAIKCIKQLKGGVKAIEPTEKAQAQFVKRLKDGLNKTVWTSNCKSWYKNKQGEVNVGNIYILFFLKKLIKIKIPFYNKNNNIFFFIYNINIGFLSLFWNRYIFLVVT